MIAQTCERDANVLNEYKRWKAAVRQLQVKQKWAEEREEERDPDPQRRDRRRLRRITAAPCLFGSAYVAESWVRAWPNYRTTCSPSGLGKALGEHVAESEHEEGAEADKDEEE